MNEQETYLCKEQAKILDEYNVTGFHVNGYGHLFIRISLNTGFLKHPQGTRFIETDEYEADIDQPDLAWLRAPKCLKSANKLLENLCERILITWSARVVEQKEWDEEGLDGLKPDIRAQKFMGLPAFKALRKRIFEQSKVIPEDISMLVYEARLKETRGRLRDIISHSIKAYGWSPEEMKTLCDESIDTITVEQIIQS